MTFAQAVGVFTSEAKTAKNGFQKSVQKFDHDAVAQAENVNCADTDAGEITIVIKRIMFKTFILKTEVAITTDRGLKNTTVFI